jgi:DNA primase catalytic core
LRIKNLGETILQLKPRLPDYLTEQGIDITQNFSCLHPQHEDKNPSCRLFSEGADHRAWCFSCNRGFDILDACCILEDKPREGKAWVLHTVKYLADKYEIPLDIGELTEEDEYEINTYRAYKIAAGLLRTNFNGEERQQEVKQEVARRQWTEETLRTHSVGGIFDYQEYITRLRKHGFTVTFLREIDLARQDIFNSDSLIFTWKDEYGRPVGFTARNLKFEEEMKKPGGRKPKKYNNIKTTGLKCNIFRKNSRLFGIDSALNSISSLWIFEGQADVITAKQAGLPNCAAFGGNILSEDQVHLVKKLGIYKIILCLDNDKAGNDKLTSILENKLSGHKDIDVKIVMLPTGEDPDSFIRTNGLEKFEKLAKWSAFEWRLNRFSEDDDPEDICSKMVPIISSEPSPLRREKLCKALSNRVDYSLQAIQDELAIILDAKAYEASRERDTVLDKLQYDLRINPSAAAETLRSAGIELTELDIKYNSDAFSNDDFLQYVQDQKRDQENKTGEYEGFRMGDDLRPLVDVFEADWTRDVVLWVGGKPGTGKSALLSKIAYEVATHNKDTTVIIHSIDDTREKVVPRLVTIAEGSKSLAMCHVGNPKYWTSQKGISEENLYRMREVGYSQVLQLARDSRLLVKDVSNGKSMSYVESLISYHSKRSEKVLYILDNFHKLDWLSHETNERVRWKKISQKVKELAEYYHVSIMATVEYPKIPSGIKPNDNNIGESNQLLYDANFTLHLYNEMADVPDSFSICHQGLNARGENIFLPRVEAIIGKSKISSVRGSFFLDFWPDSSDYRWVDQATVIRDQQSMKQEGSEDPFKGVL